MAAVLEAKNIGVRFGSLKIVDDVSFTLEEGRWLMVVGPNGAGKSTLINAVSNGIPYTGQVLFEGEDLKNKKPAWTARRIGVLTQNHNVGYSFSVGEVVRLGRYAYSRGILTGGGESDTEAVERALALTGLTKQKNQSVLTLSGGELQRTFLAQLFAQDPKVLILDEPTNHLDLVYQKQVFAIVKDWVAETGRAVLSVVHDLSLAKAYGDEALLMNGGRLAAYGKTEEVLTRSNLKTVYSMDVYEWMKKMLSQWEDNR